MAQAVEAAVEHAKIDLGFGRLEFASLRVSAAEVNRLCGDGETKHAAVIEGRFRWSDIGSWDAVFELGERDDAGNVVSGAVMTVATRTPPALDGTGEGADRRQGAQCRGSYCRDCAAA